MSITSSWPFEQVTFSRQFMLAVAALVLAAMAGTGAWVGGQIEDAALSRASHASAAYVESVFAVFLRDLPRTGPLSEPVHEALDSAFRSGRMRGELIRFKLWNPDGRILYSDDHAQIGRHYAVEDSLAEAFEGHLRSRIAIPGKRANQAERDQWSRLLEIYVPVRTSPDGKVVAVAEFYQAVDALEEEVRTAKWRSYGLVAAGGIALYALVFARVRRASDTIAAQQRDLREQLRRLQESLAENERMRERLREAGARTTALSEQHLHRIGAELHDGPAQNLAFALLRFDDMASGCGACASTRPEVERDLKAIPEALASSLAEVRAIASGLVAPGIAELALDEAAWRAVREGECKRGTPIDARFGDLSGDSTVAARITVYRLLQESMSNALRHAPGAALHVGLRREGDLLRVEVRDEGAGFDPATPAGEGHLGLSLMRERACLLGGNFTVDSAPGRGTAILATIPLGADGPSHD